MSKGEVLVGRDRQIRSSIESIQGLIAGGHDRNVLFITGEAGIGKSALLAAIRDACREIDPIPQVAEAACSTPLAGSDIGEVEALQPWAEILRRLVTGNSDEKKATRKLVADLARAWVRCIPVVGDVIESVADTAQIVSTYAHHHEGVSAVNQQQVFQQYINLIDKISHQTPLVLMLDDFHWADTSSVNLLFTAARQLRGRPVMFVVAYRPDDAASSRNGEGHPILHIRNELERYSMTSEAALGRLSVDDIDHLLRLRYPNYRNNDEFERWLVEASGGNALFITQFLETLEEDGHIDRSAGTIMAGYQQTAIPSSAYAVIQERIRRLTEETRETLRYASVEGDTFTSSVLARITELPQLKLLQRLRLVEETHQIVQSLGRQQVYARETGAYRFTHTLLHRAMYDSLNEEERRLLHELILDSLKEEWEVAKEVGINIDRMAARLSVHAAILGEHLFAAEVLLEGAQATWKAFSMDETLRFSTAALDELEAAAEHERLSTSAAMIRGRAYLLMGNVYNDRGEKEPALGSFTSACMYFEQAGNHTLRLEAMNKLAWALRLYERHDESAALANQALADAERLDDLAGIIDALNNLGNLYGGLGDHHTSLDYFQRALDIATAQSAPQNMTALAHFGIGLALHSLGDFDGADQHYQECLALCYLSGDSRRENALLTNIGVLKGQRGDYEGEIECYRRCLEIDRSMGNVRGEALALLNIGITLYNLHRYDESADYLEQARDLGRRIEQPRVEASALQNLARIEQQRGDLAAAADAFQASIDITTAVHDLENTTMCLILLGILEIERGKLDEARSLTERAEQLAVELDNPIFRARAHGVFGKIAAAEAQLLENEERHERLQSALARFDSSIALLRDVGHWEWEYWQSEREAIKQE